MIRFACPICKTSLQSRDQDSGTKFACPSCGQRLQVPAPPPPNKTVLGEPLPAPNKTILGNPEPEIRVAKPASPSGHAPGPERHAADAFAFDEPTSARLPANRGVAIMVVGIISAACYVLCLLIFWPALVVCLVMGPIAWIMGSQDLSAIRRQRLSPEGSAFVLTGYICGIVSTALAGITLVTCLLLVAWFASLFHHGRMW